MAEFRHTPVLLNEAMGMLKVMPGRIYVDGTVGGGGFSKEILRRSAPSGFLIGIDRDEDAVKNVQIELEKEFDKERFRLFYSNFSKIDSIIKESGFKDIDGIVLDLGMSSIQLEGGRGFGFREEGELDMRMDKEERLTAYEVVNNYPEKTLADIIWKYGDERHARKIAKKIAESRKNKRIETPAELSAIIKKAVFKGYGKLRIDPSTKTFMALRIFVNKEYDSLMEFLGKLENVLNTGGIVAIISFHSGEDRIVKNFFKNKLGFKSLSKKPVLPSIEELRSNPRSRSAKLRALCHV
ncbi:MAG: 16S rRNA (cytosine(1402)-N(4))-methyltransferase RsmH [Deltaproteobacteria bacterium]|nr:16S rRNA (cytosine(1402)-N(4))-methyltransferase RsmH [Deltaproteobacteria bacterium]